MVDASMGGNNVSSPQHAATSCRTDGITLPHSKRPMTTGRRRTGTCQKHLPYLVREGMDGDSKSPVVDALSGIRCPNPDLKIAKDRRKLKTGIMIRRRLRGQLRHTRLSRIVIPQPSGTAHSSEMTCIIDGEGGKKSKHRPDTSRDISHE